jgi:hypothetical protein
MTSPGVGPALALSVSVVIRKGLAFVGVLLVAFHVWLFGRQAWDGQLVDLALASRWIIAVGLTAALAYRRSHGRSLIRGRQAVAVWLLAALLHGPAVTRDLAVDAPALPEVVATLAQSVVTLGALGVVLLAGFAGRWFHTSAPLRRLAMVASPHARGTFLRESFPHFAPRPPPIA